jgi:PKD repeat protein
MRKSLIIALVLVFSTAVVSAQDTQTITLNSGDTQNIEVAGSHEVTLRYVDGGAALSIDGADSVFYDGSALEGGDMFIVDGLVADIQDYGYSPGYADIRFSSLGDTLTLYDGETVQFEQEGEVNTLKLNYVDGGASVTLNGEETSLGEELQTGDTFSADGATIEVEQTGYEGQEGFMEFKIEGINGDSASEKPVPVISMPDQVSVGEEFQVSSLESEDPDGGEITDSLAHVTTEGHDMTLWNVEGLGSQSYSFDEAGEYTIRLYVEDDEGESAETTKTITVTSVVRPEIEETFEVAAGDTVRFGPDDVNGFEVDSVNSDLVNIVPESERADTGVTERVGIVDFMDLEFESGLYRVSVVERGSERATMKLVRSYSSDFSCEDYQTGENEYKFCTNQGDEAVKQVDLGYGRSVNLNFVNNYYINNRKHTTLSGPEKALTITHGEGLEYRGAEINVNEFRGLQRDEDYEAIIQVEIPEREPEASLEFGETGYTSGDQASLTAIAEKEGLYRIEIEGPGVDQETDIESGDSTIEVQPNGAGTLEARAIAPGTWWNPLDNDRIVAKASAEVRESVEGENHRFGEKFTIQEGETTQIEGHDFYLSTLVGRAEVGYSSVLWRESEDGNTNSGLVLLKRVDSMGLQYSDGFEAYGTVCSIEPESETAEILVKQERFNPWDVCDRNPSEFRGEEQSDYEIKDYELGEKITLEEGDALEFGQSRAYLKDIDRYQDVFINDGNLEWIGETPYWSPPTEGGSTTNYFYEDKIATATCEASENRLTLVLEETDEIGGEWPENWCSEDESNNYQVELDCTTPVKTGKKTRCYVDRFDSRLGEISDYSWDKSGPGQLDLEAQSVEHTVFYAPEDVSETGKATIHYSATDEKGNTVSSSTEIEISAADDVQAIKSCSFRKDGYHAAGINVEGPRVTATLKDEAPFSSARVVWRSGDTMLAERSDVVPGTALQAEKPDLSGLEIGTRSLNASVYSDGEMISSMYCGDFEVIRALQPEVSITPENPEVGEAVEFTAYPEGDYSYNWDLNGDSQYETDGRSVSTEYADPGSHEITLKISGDGSEASRDRTFKVDQPAVSSSLEVSKDEITPDERMRIEYRTSSDIARNGYRLVVENPSGDRVYSTGSDSESGKVTFTAGGEAETGTYTARLVAKEGFLSSILRKVFGPEAEAQFRVIEASQDLSKWQERCEESGYDATTASGRASCIREDIGPSCFKENPGSECREMADMVCDYYLGTEFNPQTGKCGGQ